VAAVLQPGRPSALYHREADQEHFLVLAAARLLPVEGEERLLQAWDFVHCPPGTEHIFVGSGDGPCVLFMSRSSSGAESLVRSQSVAGGGILARWPVGRMTSRR
jgi:quercetin dioxygenase-like cupin family protein